MTWAQALALALTLLVEVPIAGALAPRSGEQPKRWRLWMLAACAASMITHPFAWHASMTHVPTLAPEEKAALIELAVVLAEAVIYAVLLRPTWRRALAVSALANLASFAVGLLWFWARA